MPWAARSPLRWQEPSAGASACSMTGRRATFNGGSTNPWGPFLSKSFATFVSPWIVTPEALEPFRAPAWPHVEEPLAYLRSPQDAAAGGVDIGLEIHLSTPLSRSKGMAPLALGSSNSQYLFWTFAQMLAHHTSNGCNLEPGDLIGSGTISGPGPLECGSLLERSRAGREPVVLDSGESRSFLQTATRSV